MSSELTATILVPPGETGGEKLAIVLHIENTSTREITILNPDMGVPSPGSSWPWSNEVYQTAMLLSFGYLSLTVTGETGETLPQQVIQTWATPVLSPFIELKPGQLLDIPIPIGRFYQLQPGSRVQLAIVYGAASCKVSASAVVNV